MNANDLWSGQDYAYVDNISRGILYYPNARRIKVMRVYQAELEAGRKKATTMVEVWPLDDDGNIRHLSDGREITMSIRARQIFMRWEEYEEETRVREEQRAQRDREWKEQRARNRGFNSIEEMEASDKAAEEARQLEQQERELARLEQQRKEEERRQELRRLELEGIERIFQLFEQNGFKREVIRNINSFEITLNRQLIDEMLTTTAEA